MVKKMEKLQKEFESLKSKYGVELSIKMDFPEYKRLPVDVQLALAVLSKHTINYIVEFKDNDNKI